MSYYPYIVVGIIILPRWIRSRIIADGQDRS
jgi:hypothetical protein